MYPGNPQFNPDEQAKEVASGKRKANASLSMNPDATNKAQKVEENDREASTYTKALKGTTVEELEDLAKYSKDGFPMSGDALARAKKGQPPKYHRG